MANVPNPNWLCAPLTIPTTLTPLVSLLQQYFATNLPGYVLDPVYSTVQYTATKGNAGTIWMGDSSMANPGTSLAVGVGSEMVAGEGFFEPYGGAPALVDVTPVYVQASAAANILLVRARRF